MPSFDGGCTCTAVRYRLTRSPLFVHCCHCTWCQRETGSAFAVNVLIETSGIDLLQGAVEQVDTPSASGRVQKIFRCPTCRIALWSHYAMAVGDKIAFVRAGTLDAPEEMPPDIHIFTSTKQPWLALPPDVPAVEAYYDRGQVWPAESLDRYAALRD